MSRKRSIAHRLEENGDVGEEEEGDDGDADGISGPDGDDESADVDIEWGAWVRGRPPEAGPARRVSVGAL